MQCSGRGNADALERAHWRERTGEGTPKRTRQEGAPKRNHRKTALSGALPECERDPSQGPRKRALLDVGVQAYWPEVGGVVVPVPVVPVVPDVPEVPVAGGVVVSVAGGVVVPVAPVPMSPVVPVAPVARAARR